MSIEGQCHFFTIHFPGFVCFVLYWAKISGERLQDHWSSGIVRGIHYFLIFAIKHRLWVLVSTVQTLCTDDSMFRVKI